MDNAPLADDSRRLDLLRALGLLDAGPEPGLDRLARIAAAVTGCQIAMITFIAGDRQFIRARVGTEVSEASMRESFCICTLDGSALVEVADARQDPRFADNRYVRGPLALRFYAGMPVLFDGEVLGTVCVFDPSPRHLTDDQRAVLADLAGMVEAFLQASHERVQLRQERERAVDLATTLGESEALLSEAQRFARLGSWDIDATTGLTAWSASLYELFGRDRALGPITTDDFRGHMVPEDRPAFDAAVERAFRDHVTSHAEFRCVLPGQPLRWIVAVSEPVRDARGRVTRLRGTLQDITDRRLSERQARESTERHRLLWQTSMDVVLMVSEDSVIRFCNPAIERMLGWLAAEVVGQPLSLLQPARMRAGHIAGFARYLASGERRLDWRAVEAVALHRDGREIPVEISFSHMQLDGQRIFGAFMRDVTQRIEQRQALQRSEERYRSIVQTAEEGIWVIDAATVTTFVNPKMARMLGYTDAEMLGRSMYDFMDERARDEAQENVRRRTSGISEQHDFRLTRKDGTDLWTAMSTSAHFDEHGAYSGALAMVTDITEQRRGEALRRELEVQLREAQKMEAIGVLAGGIAHDFNNVIAGILGNTALATQDLQVDHAAALSLEQIRKAALRGRGLVQQILAFARRQPRAVVSCELRPLLEDCVGLLRATLPAAVTLDVALGDSPLFVMADANQVQQVVMNLCTNAWHSLGGRPGRLGVALAGVDLDSAAALRLGGGLTPGAYAPPRRRGRRPRHGCRHAGAHLRAVLHHQAGGRGHGAGPGGGTRHRRRARRRHPRANGARRRQPLRDLPAALRQHGGRRTGAAARARAPRPRRARAVRRRRRGDGRDGGAAAGAPGLRRHLHQRPAGRDRGRARATAGLRRGGDGPQHAAAVRPGRRARRATPARRPAGDHQLGQPARPVAGRGPRRRGLRAGSQAVHARGARRRRALGAGRRPPARARTADDVGSLKRLRTNPARPSCRPDTSHRRCNGSPGHQPDSPRGSGEPEKKGPRERGPSPKSHGQEIIAARRTPRPCVPGSRTCRCRRRTWRSLRAHRQRPRQGAPGAARSPCRPAPG